MRFAALACACLLLGVSLAADAVAAPTHDACEDATTVTSLPFTDVSSTTGATLDLDEAPTACAPSISASVWYAIDVPADGELVVSTAGSRFDSVLSVFGGTCGALEERACDDDGGDGTLSLVVVPVTGGETVLVRVAAYQNAPPGDLVLTAVLGRPPHDACATPLEVADLPYLDDTTTVGATSETHEPSADCFAPHETVWYRFIPPRSGFVVADTAGSSFDTVLAAYVGECADLEQEPAALEPVACNDDAGTLQAAVGLPVTANVPVRFQVGAYSVYEVGALRFHVAWAEPPFNDTCDAAATLAVPPATAEHFVVGATRDTGPESGCGSGAASVWYVLTAPVGGLLTIDTLGSDYDTVLDTFTGPCEAATPRGCNDDLRLGTMHSEVRVGVAAGEVIRIAVSAFGDSPGRNLVLNVRLDPCTVDEECGDADICTDDACIDGMCVFSTDASCCRADMECDDGDACTHDVCDLTHLCRHDVVTGCCAADAACDDGNVCTQDACVGHRCVFTIIPECCRTDVSCDDGDVCTTDTCEANTCIAALPAGLDAVRCRLDGDALTCGPDAMADRLRRALHRRINRAQSRLERAAVSGDARRTKRLLRRAATQVQRARRRIERALRREKLAPRCADALLDALAPKPPPVL